MTRLLLLTLLGVTAAAVWVWLRRHGRNELPFTRRIADKQSESETDLDATQQEPLARDVVATGGSNSVETIDDHLIGVKQDRELEPEPPVVQEAEEEEAEPAHAPSAPAAWDTEAEVIRFGPKTIRR